MWNASKDMLGRIRFTLEEDSAALTFGAMIAPTWRLHVFRDKNGLLNLKDRRALL